MFLMKLRDHLPQKIFLLVLSIGLFVIVQINSLEIGSLKFEIYSKKLQDFISLFLSVIVEAFPFVIIGVLVSIFVALFVKEQWLSKFLPKNRFLSHIYVSFIGMFMPVCECGNVPVTRRLMMKGFSLSQSITFFLAAPILNPITLFATWKAFEPDSRYVILRFVCALIIANAVGLLISLRKKQEDYMTKEFHELCEHDHDHGSKNLFKKATDILQSEFVAIMKMLIIGAGVAALFQTLIPREVLTSLGSNLFLSVIAMMAFAFIISVCSNVDAFVVLYYVKQFSIGSIMAFLIFGPMIDMKILTMLKSTFKTEFLVMLTALVALMSLFAGLVINLLF